MLKDLNIEQHRWHVVVFMIAFYIALAWLIEGAPW